MAQVCGAKTVGGETRRKKVDPPKKETRKCAIWEIASVVARPAPLPRVLQDDYVVTSLPRSFVFRFERVVPPEKRVLA